MPTRVEPSNPFAAIIAEETALFQRVTAFLVQRAAQQAPDLQLHDQELLELRDAIAEAKPEDLPPLVEQMARVSALAAGRRGKATGVMDRQVPYFAHVRLRAQLARRGGETKARDVLIGRYGLIDRTADIQIVDWRDAPVSQLYYRYEEGDDYDEDINGQRLQGIIEVRRSLTIQDGTLRRIGCPQGTFFADSAGHWWQIEEALSPTLFGGQGLAARAPRSTPPRPAQPHKSPSPGPSLVGRSDKHLPEIAALIDRHQFDLISEPESGVVVIQGGAGSGKTTVALHRVAFLAHAKPDRFRGAKIMVIVPSDALVRYVGGVLPALGVPSVPVQTCQGWMRHHLRRLLRHLPDHYTTDPPTVVARLKKHPGMLHVLDRYVARQASELRAQLGQALVEQPAIQKQILDLWDKLNKRPLRARCRGVRTHLPSSLEPGLAARIDELLRRMGRRAKDVTRDWSELLTDPDLLAAGYDDAAKKGATPVTRSQIAALVEYCSAQQEDVESPLDDDELDSERFAAVDGRPLDEDNPAGQIDREDVPLLLRLIQLKLGGLPHASGKGFVQYEHMVLDEVQDLSAIEVKTLIETVHGEEKPRSITMAGDVVQRLVFDTGIASWEELLETVSLRDARVQRLRILYRSTIEVMQLAMAVLGPLASDTTVNEGQSAVRHGAPVQAFRFGEIGEAVAFLGEALRSLLSREPSASVVLISRYQATADAYFRGLSRTDVPSLRRVQSQEFTFAAGVDITDVTQVKGLEFDYVVILDAGQSVYNDTVEARHLLHIAMTRAAHQLWLVTTEEPSPLVPPHYFALEATA